MEDQNQYQNQNQYQSPYQNQYPQNNGDEPGKGAAVASLVLGIVGLFFAGIILGIIGLVMASSARNQGYMGGIRTAGFILSLLSLIFGALAAIACVPILLI